MTDFHEQEHIAALFSERLQLAHGPGQTKDGRATRVDHWKKISYYILFHTYCHSFQACKKHSPSFDSGTSIEGKIGIPSRNFRLQWGASNHGSSIEHNIAFKESASPVWEEVTYWWFADRRSPLPPWCGWTLWQTLCAASTMLRKGASARWCSGEAARKPSGVETIFSWVD